MGGSENRSFIAHGRSQIRRFNSVYPHDRPSIHHPTSNVIHDLPSSSGGPPPSLCHSRCPAAPTISISFLFRVPRTRATDIHARRSNFRSSELRKKDGCRRRVGVTEFSFHGRSFFSARSRWSVVMKIQGAASCIVLVPVAFGSCRASTHDRKDMDASS